MHLSNLLETWPAKSIYSESGDKNILFVACCKLLLPSNHLIVVTFIESLFFLSFQFKSELQLSVKTENGLAYPCLNKNNHAWKLIFMIMRKFYVLNVLL